MQAIAAPAARQLLLLGLRVASSRWQMVSMVTQALPQLGRLRGTAVAGGSTGRPRIPTRVRCCGPVLGLLAADAGMLRGP